MGVAKLNKRAYSNLKKNYSRSREFHEAIKKGNRDMSSNLIPKEAARQADGNGKDYQKMLDSAQKAYDKKLSNLDKAYSKKMSNMQSSSNADIKALQKRLAKSNKMYEGLSKSTQSVVSRLSEQVNKNASNIGKTKPSTTTTENKTGTEVTDNATEEKDTHFDFDPIALATKVNKYNEERATKLVEDEKAKESGVVNTVMDKTFKNVSLSTIAMPEDPLAFEKQNIQMGEYQMRVGEGFKIRQWEDRKGQHSKGIDLRLFKNNKPIDYPMVIADGKIVNIALDGNGKRISTSQGQKGGVYIYVQLDEDPNKIVRMMHLPISFYNNRTKYMGKNVKRGDVLIEDNDVTGSVSAPHIKYSIADYNPATQKSKLNYGDSENDPSRLFFTGSLIK